MNSVGDKKRKLSILIPALYDVSLRDILGRSRKAEYVAPRKAYHYFLRRLLGFSYPYIGDLVERDHSTVMYNCRTFDKDKFYKLCGVNEEYVKDYISEE